MAARTRRRKRQPGNIEELPSGALRVTVYAGIVRRFNTQVDERRHPRTTATVDQLLDRYFDMVDLELNTAAARRRARPGRCAAPLRCSGLPRHLRRCGRSTSPATSSASFRAPAQVRPGRRFVGCRYNPADPLAPVGNPAQGAPMPPEVGNAPQLPLQDLPPLRFPPNQLGQDPRPGDGVQEKPRT
jgi:hypothetical protein